MKSVRRYEIWYADLKNISIKENHFVLIVSNWKNNCKSSTVNICVLTTKDKPHPSHIKVMNLGKEVTVCCENIYTIKKSSLIYKAGAVEDIEKQVDVDNSLSMQLQIDGKYVNNNINELKNFFTKATKNMNNEKECYNLKCKIRNLNITKDYKQALSTCDKLIEETNNSNIENKNDNYWYGYYHKAVMLFKLEQYKEALQSAEKSLKYIGKINIKNELYGWTIWLLAACFEKLNDKEKALDIYKYLSLFYKKIGNINMRIAMISSQAKILRNINRIKQLIKILENIENNEYKTDKTNKQLLEDMRKDLKELSN